MPYRKKGNTVQVKKGGKWKKVGKSTKGKVKKYLKVLRAVEHGWKK